VDKRPQFRGKGLGRMLADRITRVESHCRFPVGFLSATLKK